MPGFLSRFCFFFNAGLALLLFVLHGVEIIYLNPFRTEPLNTFFRWVTRLGEAPAFVVLGLVSMLWRFRYALLIALAGLIIMPTSYLLKDQIGTARPITYFADHSVSNYVVFVPDVRLHGGQTSFPSGHTMAAFGLFGVIALLGGRRWPLLGLACASTAMLVALSRIFLVQHFLVDVLGGVGRAFVAAVVWEINTRWLQNHKGLDTGIYKQPDMDIEATPLPRKDLKN
ncbi:MAG: phosphatase PAP2 family protein [Lewinellaceae bacterium]|nr:phosphatase PAP2 family protein [Lewinellaceae bacterium]